MTIVAQQSSFTIDSRPLFQKYLEIRRMARKDGPVVFHDYRNWYKCFTVTLRMTEGVDFEMRKAKFGRKICMLNAESAVRVDGFLNDPVTFRQQHMTARQKHGDAFKSGVFTCATCEKTLPISSFYEDKTKRYRALYFVCRSCSCENKAKFKTKRWSTLEGSLDVQMKNAAKKCETKKLAFDIDIPFLVSLWSSQNGRCFYTGRKMNFKRISAHGMGPGKIRDMSMVSIDRVDSGEGYIKSNVVLCLSIVNLMKNNLSLNDFHDIARAICRHKRKQQDKNNQSHHQPLFS